MSQISERKILNYIKSSCIIFCAKVFQYFDVPYIKSITQEKSVRFLFSHILIFSISFFSYHAKVPPSLRMHAIDFNFQLIYF